jgi:hypothetical protein
MSPDIACLHDTLTALGAVTGSFKDYALRLLPSKAAAAALLALGLLGCRHEGDVMATGILTSYTACPPVAIAAPTGDVTLFNPSNSRDSSAIDVVAQITNVRGTCDDSGEYINTQITFDVQARRRDGQGARDVILPFFVSVVQGNTNVVAKRVSNVGIHFAEGEIRASTSATASSQVLRSAATLPDDVRHQITRERRAGDPNAAVDPMADPAVRAAVDRARFEVLLGFELDQDQLRYNATR